MRPIGTYRAVAGSPAGVGSASLTTIVLTAIVLQSISLALSMGLFALNRDRLTATVCEHTRKNCHACCYLAKQMNDEAPSGTANAPRDPGKQLTRQLEDWHAPQADLLEFSSPLQELATLWSTTPSANLSSGHPDKLLNPPRA